jgi:NitT/TauT family transport system substrate-binding protein
MSRFDDCCGLVAACLLSACTPSGPGAGLHAVRVGYSGEADFGDLPSLVAHRRLRAEGLVLEVTHFSAPDLAIEAASRGSADIVHGTMIGAWAAAARGARIRTVADHLANPYRLVVRSAITTCADLGGRRLAFAGDSAVSTTFVRGFLAEACPDTDPIMLLVQESSARAAALMAGGVDAAALDLNTLLWIAEHAPGRFHVLSNFAQRWPGIKTTGVHVNIDFADRDPELLEEYLGALLEAALDLQGNRGLLIAEAARSLGTGQDWAAVADAYRDEGTWADDEGLTRADVVRTLAFFKTYGGLEPVSPEAVIHPGFLDRPRHFSRP